MDIFHLWKNLFNVLLIKQGPLSVSCCGSPTIAKHCKKWFLAWVAFSPEWVVAQHPLEYMYKMVLISLPKKLGFNQ